MGDQKKAEAVSKSLIAKKDWHIVCGNWDKKTGKSEYDIVIKKGDDLSSVPKMFHDGLKAEHVI